MEQRTRSTAGSNLGWLAGALLIVLGAAALLDQVFSFSFGAMVWALIFGGTGIAFYALTLRSPASRWALIPAYVFVAVGLVIAFSTIGLDGSLMGIFIMLAIGFPFLYVYLRNRQQWWALIPAYTMAAVAGIIALSEVIHDSPIVPAYIMFAIALPFYYVYFRNRSNRWALIPAGIMTLVGLGIFTLSYQYVLPIALIGLGVFLLVRQMGGRGGPAAAKPPLTGPEADKPTK